MYMRTNTRATNVSESLAERLASQTSLPASSRRLNYDSGIRTWQALDTAGGQHWRSASLNIHAASLTGGLAASSLNERMHYRSCDGRRGSPGYYPPALVGFDGDGG